MVGTVGGGDSIAAIAQRRTDGAALADAEAVAERVALIRLQRLGEAAGAVIGQRHRTNIDDGWHCWWWRQYCRYCSASH